MANRARGSSRARRRAAPCSQLRLSGSGGPVGVRTVHVRPPGLSCEPASRHDDDLRNTEHRAMRRGRPTVDATARSASDTTTVTTGSRERDVMPASPAAPTW
ncbi:MAG: hypothetical protein RI885_2200 [Actinomycetota bacterium]